MRRLMPSLVFLSAFAAAVVAVVTNAWGVVVALALAGFGLWRFGRCHHPAPLGLLPPRTDDDGAQLPARWFCDACGKTWPAVFERGRQPIRRFEGYDQSKAVSAARRAKDFARRQRALALRRAGFETRRQPKVRRGAAEVVAMGQVRRFAK